MLENDKINFTTFQPLEYREFSVAMRGISQSFSKEEILEKIQINIPSVLRVQRMKNKRKMFPLVVVYLDSKSPNAWSIFDLRSVGSLSVRVEPKRKSNLVPQCQRYQIFRHTANYCHVPSVCAFCCRNNITTEYKIKNKYDSPTCANCNGDHWATFRECPKI